MDLSILYFIKEHFHNGFTDPLFTGVTYLGEIGAIWVVIGLLLCLKKQYRTSGILLLAALLCTFLLGDCLLKNLVQRPRPFQEIPTTLLIAPPAGFSFPSGHSSSSFAAAFILYRTKKIWGVAAFLLAVLIAFSRLFLFVHYPSDVLTGALLGLLTGWLIWKFGKSRVENRIKNKNDS